MNRGQSSDDNGTSNGTTLGFHEMISQCPDNAFVDRLNNTTTDEKTFCPIAHPKFLVVGPNVISHLRLCVEILEEVLVILPHCFLNTKLRFFAVWDEQLRLFTVRWYSRIVYKVPISKGWISRSKGEARIANMDDGYQISSASPAQMLIYSSQRI